jgi:hypothetical protein
MGKPGVAEHPGPEILTTVPLYRPKRQALLTLQLIVEEIRVVRSAALLNPARPFILTTSNV